MQRRKGADGERELAKVLSELLGVELKRNLSQPREGGVDLKEEMPSMLDPWAIESKRAKKPLLNTWWQQTCEQAEKAGKRPVLFYRIDRQQWRVVMALRHVATGFDHAPLTLRLETDLEVFAVIAREVHHAAPDKPELICACCRKFKPRPMIVSAYWIRDGQQAQYRCRACEDARLKRLRDMRASV